MAASVIANQTLVGRVGNVYEPRTVGKDNREVVDFTVAVTPRRLEGDTWVDGETYWSTITVWGRLATNVVKSLKKGDRVIVIGHTEMKPAYTNKEGVEQPARAGITADFVGLDLTYDSAQSNREARGEGGGSYNRSKPAAAASKPAAKKAEKSADPFDDDLLDFGDDDDDSSPIF